MIADRTTVVVGVDDSDEARSALRWAADYARFARRGSAWFTRSSHIISPASSGSPSFSTTRSGADAKHWLAGVVGREIGDVTGLEPEPHIAQNGPAAAILAAADRSALIVVGARGRGAFSAL